MNDKGTILTQRIQSKALFLSLKSVIYLSEILNYVMEIVWSFVSRNCFVVSWFCLVRVGSFRVLVNKMILYPLLSNVR